MPSAAKHYHSVEAEQSYRIRGVVLLGVCALLSFALRTSIAATQPFTNDEGAYLYDAKTFREGRLPAGDVVVKTPVIAGLFTGAVWMSGDSLFATRGVSVLAALLSVLPLYFLTHTLADSRTARITCILWLLSPASILLLTLGHAQPVSNLLALLTLAVGVCLLQQPKKRAYAFVCGVLIVLAFAARKTNLVVVVPLVVYWFIREKPRVALSKVLWLCAGLTVATIPWLWFVHRWYGLKGVMDSLGVSVASIVLKYLLDSGSVPHWGGGFIWVTQTLSRIAPVEGLLVLLALALTIQEIGLIVWRPVASVGWYIAAICASLIALVVPPTPGRLLFQLIWLSGGVALAYGGWRGHFFHPNRKILSSSVAWFLALGALYATWPTLLVEYTADFLPATILAGGVAVATILPRRYTLSYVAVTLTIVLGLSLYSAVQAPWTGMFSVHAIKAAAATLSAQVPREKPIFTGAVIIPYYSGHRVLFDSAHPLWYQFSFITSDEQERYLPAVARLETALASGQVGAVISEHLTDYAYRQRQQGIDRIIKSQWKHFLTIENETGFRSNPVQVYVPRDEE